MASTAWSVFSVVAMSVAVALPRLVTQLHDGDTAMRGLTGVAVVVETLAPDVRPYGLTEDWLEQRVAAALRRGGRTPWARSDALGMAREPLLVVRLETMRVPGERAFAWHLSTAVHQRVALLDSASTRTRAATWSAQTVVGVTSGATLRGSVAGSVDDQVGELIQAWRN